MISLIKPVLSEIGKIKINREQSKRLMVVLRTKGCSYAKKCRGCKHCSLIKHSNNKITSLNLQIQLDDTLKKYQNHDFGHLDLLTLGSFLDEKEIPKDFFKYSLERVSKIKSLKRVMIESRPEFVNKRKIKEAAKLLGDKELEVGIGVESSDDYIREIVLNKGFSLEDVEKTIKILSEFKVGFLGYVLVKPLGLSESQAIEDAIKTIRYLFALGKKHRVKTRMALVPFYIPKNSSAEMKYKLGEYRPPKLWSIIEILRKTNNLGTIFIGLNDEGLSEGLITSNCNLCDQKFMNALEEYNGTNNLKCFSKLNCSCYVNWKDLVGGIK